MVERTAEFILGLIGGIIGIIAAPILFFVGAFIAFLGGPGELLGYAFAGGVLSVVGLIGAAFVKSRPKISGVIMVVTGVLGLFVALGFWMGALLFIVAGIVALIRKEKKVQSASLPTVQTVHYCRNCGKPLTYIEQYGRWYCENCARYD